MKWLKRVIVSSVVVVMMAAPVHAAEQIPDFTSVVTVQKSGRVDVTETIAYDFGYTARHGIYRYIPVQYKDGADDYRPNFDFDAVSLNGASVPYDVSSSGVSRVIKIGDPDKTITGLQIYTINYHFESLLLAKDGDLLRFNVVGSGWQVPIRQAKVTLVTPATPQLVCYTGEVGSTEKNCVIDKASNSVTAANVGDGSDLTVEALIPAGTVTNVMQPYKTPWWQIALVWGVVIYIIIGIVLLIAASIRYLLIRRKEKQAERQQTIIAQYEPPKNLSPGEIGVLTDNKASLVEVTATLIQAAVSGYIKIEQVADKTMFKKAEYKLIKIKEFTGLSDAEQALLNVMFEGSKEINLKDSDKTSLAAAVKKYQQSLRDSVTAKGMYTKTSKLSVLGGFGGFVLILILIFTPLVFLLGALAVPVGIYVYIRAGKVARRSPEGLETWAYVEGFKLFLSVTEKDRLAFTDAPSRTPKQFSAFLPYAIALGVEEEWAKQFEGIDIAPSMGWYGGNGRAFTAGYIVGNLNDSFASTVAASSTPPSSSGGSSGGGFGGGGGGSW